MYSGETGQTDTTIYKRIANHSTTIKNVQDDIVPQHFNSGGHDLKAKDITYILQMARQRENENKPGCLKRMGGIELRGRHNQHKGNQHT